VRFLVGNRPTLSCTPQTDRQRESWNEALYSDTVNVPQPRLKADPYAKSLYCVACSLDSIRASN